MRQNGDASEVPNFGKCNAIVVVIAACRPNAFVSRPDVLLLRLKTRRLIRQRSIPHHRAANYGRRC